MARPSARTGSTVDSRATALLAAGLGLLLFALPLPLGATRWGGRLLLEVGCLALLVPWLLAFRAGRCGAPRPVVLAGLFGLLALGALQLAPLPEALGRALAPEAARIRAEVRPSEAILEAERAVLGASTAPLGAPAPTLSLDPEATASALRTGAALVFLLLAGAAVAASRGVRGIALALLFSTAFQGLYGVLVLASGYDRIWNVPKPIALDAATGTFINPNHFASYLALTLPCGLALIWDRARRSLASGDARRRWLALGGDGGKVLLLLLLLGCGLAGLLTSNSRAGIPLGVLALALTAITGSRRGLAARLAVVALLLAAAALPLLQLGTERLVEDYLASGSELRWESGRTRVWSDTLGIVAAFPVAGSGFGTFGAVYPLFRSPEIRSFYLHAHQDLLQWAAEGGAAGLALLTLLLVPALRGLVRGLGGRQGALANGLAAGLGAVLLHSLIDFPFHLPAIAATAAVVAGALLVEPWADPSCS